MGKLEELKDELGKNTYTIKLRNIESGRNAGSESSHSWVRIISSLGPNRIGSEIYQGSERSWVRIVRLPYKLTYEPSAQVS